MHPIAAGFAALALVIGGVTVQVTGSTSTLNARPMPPDPAHPEVLIPTTEIRIGQWPLMDDGTRWKVTTFRGVPGGGIAVTLKPNPAFSAHLVFTVAKNDIGVPIWWVGEVGEAPPTPTPTQSDDGMGDPIPSPTPTPDPSPTPEPPAEGA